MELTFLDDTPRYNEHAIVISGENSLGMSMKKYLMWEVGDLVMAVFEIRYDYHCSPFKEAIIENLTLAVGYEGYFYLFDLAENQSILSLEMSGYFGHLYFDDNCFYVADADGLYRIDETGTILWHNNNLGIDGVIINDFTDNTITGQGEWDPPGGWIDFVLDKQTGLLIEK